MSGFTQFVSSASAGRVATFGGQLVANAAQGIFALGLASLGVGHAIVSDDSPARNIQFDFQATSEWASRFDFDPSRRPVAAIGHYSFASGELIIENNAQGLQPGGWPSTRIGHPIASGDVLARNIVFDFDLVQLGEMALHFNFAGPNVISSVGGLASTRFGVHEVEAPIFFAPSGWVSTRLGHSIVSGDFLARQVVFDFELVQPASLAAHFNFGGPNVLAARGLDSLQLANPVVDNSALGVFGPGWMSSRLGHSIVSDDLLARSIGFDFAVVSTSSLPIQFVFGGNNRTARFDLGLDSFESGTALVETPPVIYPVGWDSLEVGGLGTMRWLAYPHGVDSLRFGPLTGIHFPGYILGQGLHQTQFGTPDVPGIVFSGMRGTAWGQTGTEVIAPPEDQVLEAPHVDPPEYGDTFVSNYWRVVSLDGFGYSGLSAGVESRVSRSPKFVFVPHTNLFFLHGFPTVGFGIEIVMSPVHPLSRFGTAIVDHARIFPRDLHQTNYGVPKIENTAQAVQFYSGQWGVVWGSPAVFTDQIVLIDTDCTLAASRCGARFSQYATVVNRNQVVRPEGWRSHRMAFFPAGVALGGRPVFPAGFQSHHFAQFWEGRHQVAFAIREFTIGGHHSLIFPRWTRLHNSARVLGAQWLAGTQFGVPDAERLLQTIRMWGRNTLQMGGIEWVSRGPRFVIPLSILPRHIQHGPFVAFGARYLEPAGIDSFRWASATVIGRPVPTVRPRWRQLWEQDLELMGRPGIRNVTPQIWPSGFFGTRFAFRPFWASHSPRYLEPEAIAARFGRARIADSTQTLAIDGLDLTRVGQNTDVWHDPPVTFLPGMRPVFLSGFDSLDMGLWEFLESVVHMQGFQSMTGGDTFVHANSIMFDTRHNLQHGWTQFSTGHMLFGGQDELIVDEFEHVTYGAQYGKPRVSPHTIWARNDTPLQAAQNHPGRSWCDVDKFCQGTHPFHSPTLSAGSAVDGPWFGRARVDGKVTQAADISGSGASRYFFRSGWTNISFGTNYVTPDADTPTRFGFPVVMTDAPQTVRFRSGVAPADDFALFGVTDNGPRFVTNQGLDSFYTGTLDWPDFSTFEVQNLHREVTPVGDKMTIWGDNDPMVHFPREVTPVDSDLTVWGVQWISHSPRWRDLPGFDSFTTDWTEFQRWMKVYNLNFVHFGFAYNLLADYGEPVVSSGDTHISPYGINPVCASPGFEVSHGIV